MNIEDIKTPNDLIEANNAQQSDDAIVDAALDAGIKVGHKVVLRLTKAAIDFHKKSLAEYATDDKIDPMAVILWTKDLTNLENALILLDSIDLGEEE